MPFGGGRRKCIGDQFALFETLVALAMFMRRFDFELAPGKPEVGMTTGTGVGARSGEYEIQTSQCGGGGACESLCGHVSERHHVLPASLTTPVI